ncbi:MAG TPA: hypothetical protein VGI46_20800 [Candidatus Acidoferrum sp.]
MIEKKIQTAERWNHATISANLRFPNMTNEVIRKALLRNMAAIPVK